MPETNQHNQYVGKWGEQSAIDLLVSKGYVILDRNVFTPYGEVDLVASFYGETVFVEVKTRTSDALGNPEDAVTPRKRQRMAKAAAHTAEQMQIEAYRLDVVAITGTPNHVTDITHFENI